MGCGLRQLAELFCRHLLQGMTFCLLFCTLAVIPVSGEAVEFLMDGETESPLEQNEQPEEMALSRESLCGVRKQNGSDGWQKSVVAGESPDRCDRILCERACCKPAPGCEGFIPIRC